MGQTLNDGALLICDNTLVVIFGDIGIMRAARFAVGDAIPSPPRGVRACNRIGLLLTQHRFGQHLGQDIEKGLEGLRDRSRPIRRRLSRLGGPQ
jgi:hypothetical protein